MHVPDDPSDDSRIKELLTSDTVAGLEKGLQLLDKHYRELIFAGLRKWNPSLLPTDLADIWEMTLVSVAKNVMNKKFTEKGDLHAYLRKIARRRAIDLLRKQNKLTFGDSADEVAAPAIRLLAELQEELEHCCEELSETERFVVQLDISLFFEAGNWPSLEDLTEVYNRQYGTTEHLKTISSRRYRGRESLRRVLTRRGYYG